MPPSYTRTPFTAWHRHDSFGSYGDDTTRIPVGCFIRRSHVVVICRQVVGAAARDAIGAADIFIRCLGSSSPPILARGEARRLHGQLADCLSHLLAPAPEGEWTEGQRAVMQPYFETVLDDLSIALGIDEIR
jgi:hypothetical protein